MDIMFWVWLGVIVLTVIVEIATLELVSIWFSFGAVIPFILSALNVIPMEFQIIIFVIVSGLLIILLRKYAQKLLFKNMNEKTNVQAFEGKVVRLLEDVDFEKSGSVKVNDIVWTAVTDDGSSLKKGDLVEITKVEGNKFIVKKYEEKIENKKDGTEDDFIIEKKVEEKKEEN